MRQEVLDRALQELQDKKITKIGAGEDAGREEVLFIIWFEDDTWIKVVVDVDSYQTIMFADEEYADVIEWSSPRGGEEESKMGQVTKDTKILKG